MTETEKVKAEIKVLESKLALLEAIEKHKSPEEEAYFRAYGVYPITDARCDPSLRWRVDQWNAFETGYTSAYTSVTKDWKVVNAEFQPTPPMARYRAEPEEVEKELRQAFKQVVEQGVVSGAEKAHKGKQASIVIDLIEPVTDVSKAEPPDRLTFPLGGTLEVITRDWWDHVFGVAYGTETNNQHINDLICRIEAWLPKPQSAAGSQNAYVECTVDGFNDCLDRIKGKLR